MSQPFKQPTEEAKKEALNHPNGYVYVIDETISAAPNNIPPEAIVGAWKVNQNGIIEGDFISNPNYNQS